MKILILINLLANLPQLANYEDTIIENPLLAEYGRTLPSMLKERSDFEMERDAVLTKSSISFDQKKALINSLNETKRITELATQYAWAIPNQAALQAITKYSRIVEIGAGSGYWANLLNQMGVDVVAYDDFSWKTSLERTWFPVRRGGATMALKHPDRALFLCWPPQNTMMATVALLNYRNAGGETVIYVGEWGQHSATAEWQFFEQLRDFEKVEEILIPNWPGYADRMSIWKLKSPDRN